MFERPAIAGRQLTGQPSQHWLDHLGHGDLVHRFQVVRDVTKRTTTGFRTVPPIGEFALQA
jgi:hypothetical protein